MSDFFLILCSFVIFSFVNCQYYIVKAPNVIRFNHAETVNVSVFGLVSAKAKVKIWLQHGDKIFSVREVLVKNEREPMTTSVRVKERDLSGVNVENGRPRSLWIFSEYEGTKKSREVAINYQSGYAPTDKRIFTTKEKVYRMFATKKLLKRSTRQHETMKITKHELTVRNYPDAPNEHLEWNSDTRGIHKQNNRVPRATDCTANGVLENGTFIERNQTTNGIVRYYTCSEKHTSNIPGLEKKRFKCNGSEWISSSKKGQVLPLSNVTCKAIQCMELSDPKNGIVTMQGVYVGDTAIFSCNEGFYWDGREEITCMQTGQWSDANAMCKKKELGTTRCSYTNDTNHVIGMNLTCAGMFSTNSICVSDICTCPSGFVTNSEKTSCEQGQLGITTCADSSDLITDETRTCAEVFSTGSICISGICKCSAGYVMNSGKSACEKGQLGINSCANGSNLLTDDTRTCAEVFSSGSTCASNVCKCSTGYVMNFGKLECLRGQLGNTTCGSNLVTGDTRTCEEVFSTGTTCASGICKCATGYVTNPGKSACIQGQLGITTCGANLVTGDTRTCEEVFSTGPTCASGICKCATGYVTNPGKSACIQGQLGNTTCGSSLVTGDTRTCEEVFSTGTTCASGICKCATGYVTNPGKSACIQGQLGNTTCGSNFVTGDTRTCEEVFSTGTTCASGICKCATGYVTNPGKSACIHGQLGIATCADGSNLLTDDNRTCLEVFLPGATCVSNVCKCSSKYVMNSGKSACVQGQLGITTCAVGSDLITHDTRMCAEVFSTGSTCMSGLCKCSAEYVMNYGKSACEQGKLGITPCAKDSNLVANDTRTCAEVFSMGSSCESNVCKCSTGYVANSGKSACIEVLQCLEDKDYMGNYWNTSSPGREMNIACPEGFTGMVSRFCDGNGFYQPPVYNCTRTELKAIQTEVLQNTTFNVTSILARLATATADDGKANGTLLLGDVDITNNILMKITEAIDDNYTKMFELADLFLNVANNMLKENTTSTWKVKINKTGEGINTLLENVDRFIEKVVGVTNTSNISSTEFQKTNMYLKVGSTASCVNGFRFPDRNDTEIPDWAANTTDYVDVPCSINDTARAYSSVIYRNISNIIPSTTFSNYRAVPMKVDTPVISFSFLPSDNRKLHTPIQLNFRLFSKSLVDPVCSFWTKGNSSGSGHWSSDGCWLENYNKIDGTVVCKCNHLTNFAVLTSPSSIALREHHRVLSIISMVGCIISMVALFITVTVHMVFWRKLKSEKTVINMCLCCTLFLAYLLFLTGIEQTDNKDVCKAFAVMLHFVYLAAFFIMLVEGVYLVNMAFIPTKKYKLSKPLLVASYVMAAVIVAVSGGSVQLDGYGTSAHCWLSTETGLIWAFVGPVLLIVLINIIIVAAVIWRMCGTKATSNKTNKEKTKSGLRNLLVLMPVMGVTWLFGVFSINGDTISFQYLFAIFNSLQGLLIFIFYCWKDRKVQDAFRTASSSRKLTQLISHSSESGSSTSPTKNTSNTDV